MAGKPSLNFLEAGARITRTDSTWGSELGVSALVTFAFRATGPTYDNGVTGTYAQFNSQQIATALLAVQSWSDVANITFARQGTGTSGTAAYSDNASILLGAINSGENYYRGFAYLPGDATTPSDRSAGAADGDVIINNIWSFIQAPALWNRGFLVLTHEIGHAIGLSHPGDYNRAPGVEPTYAANAEFAEDTVQYSVMSYFGEGNTGANYHGFYAAAPQLYDIAAAQRLYGANMTTRTGDTVYGFNSTADRPWFSSASASAPIIFAVWDAGGTDTFDFSGYAQNQRIDLQQNHFSDVGGLLGNVSIAQDVVIENAIGGSGADTLIGNAAANALSGGAGADTLTGLGGNDVLNGGTGADRLDGGTGFDTAVFAVSTAVIADLNAGTAAIGGETDILVSIENLLGGSAADSLSGNAKPNDLNGMVGADTLSGSGGRDHLTGGVGADLLTGGLGGDYFVFASVAESGRGLNARDVIMDLGAIDKIVLSGIDANTLLDGDQAFALIHGAFSGAAGEMRLVYNAKHDQTYLQADVNGDKKDDLFVVIDGDHRDFDNFVL